MISHFFLFNWILWEYFSWYIYLCKGVAKNAGWLVNVIVENVKRVYFALVYTFGLKLQNVMHALAFLDNIHTYWRSYTLMCDHEHIVSVTLLYIIYMDKWCMRKTDTFLQERIGPCLCRVITYIVLLLIVLSTYKLLCCFIYAKYFALFRDKFTWFKSFRSVFLLSDLSTNKIWSWNNNLRTSFSHIEKKKIINKQWKRINYRNIDIKMFLSLVSIS